MDPVSHCGGVPSVPTVFPASTVTWPIIPHTCCTYVYTSLPILKYTEVARLLTCLHLSTSGDPAFVFTCGHASQHVISTHVHIFEYKTKHVERQRELPPLHTLFPARNCSRLLGHTPLWTYKMAAKEERDHEDQHVTHVAFMHCRPCWKVGKFAGWDEVIRKMLTW